jgi:hypothetical protein
MLKSESEVRKLTAGTASDEITVAPIADLTKDISGITKFMDEFTRTNISVIVENQTGKTKLEQNGYYTTNSTCEEAPQDAMPGEFDVSEFKGHLEGDYFVMVYLFNNPKGNGSSKCSLVIWGSSIPSPFANKGQYQLVKIYSTAKTADKSLWLEQASNLHPAGTPSRPEGSGLKATTSMNEGKKTVLYVTVKDD